MTWPASAAPCLTPARLANSPGLEPGKTYCYKPSYGTIRPCDGRANDAEADASRRQRRRKGNPGASTRATYTGNFIELDADLRALTGITHETVVKAAVDAGLDVPPIVRREYPGLFVEIPERFANGRFSAVERVKQALLPAPFQREPVSVADVDKFIEHAHYLLATVRCERTRRAALNPDMGAGLRPHGERPHRRHRLLPLAAPAD